jgi:hypothetical protein
VVMIPWCFTYLCWNIPKNHAVAKRQAFEAITWLTVPLASVHMGEEMAT